MVDSNFYAINLLIKAKQKTKRFAAMKRMISPKDQRL